MGGALVGEGHTLRSLLRPKSKMRCIKDLS